MATRYDSFLMPGSEPPPRPNTFGDIRAAIKARKRKASEDPRNPLATAGLYEAPRRMAVDQLDEDAQLAGIVPDEGEPFVMPRQRLPMGAGEGDVLRVPTMGGRPQMGSATRDIEEGIRRRLEGENRRRRMIPAAEDERNPLVAAGVYGGIEQPEPEPERPMQTLPARRITAPAPTPQEQAVGRQQLAQLERARAFSRGAERVAEPFVQFQGGRVDVPLSLAQGGANILGAIGVPGAERASAGIGEARQAVRERLVGEPETDVGTAANVAGIMRGAIGSYLMPSRVMGAAAQAAPAGSAAARAAQMAANPLGRAGLTNAGRVNRAGQLASGALLTAPLDVASSFSPDAAATGLTAIGEAMEGQPGALPAFLRGAGRVAEPFAETQAGRTAFELLSGLVPSAAVTGVGAGVSRARGGMARGRLAEALASGDMAAADRIRTAEAQRRVGEGVELPGAAIIPERVQVPRKPTGEQMARAEFEAEADRLQAVIDGPDRKAARAARKDLEALLAREISSVEAPRPVQGPQRWRGAGQRMQGASQPASAPGLLQRAGEAASAQLGQIGDDLSIVAQEALQATRAGLRAGGRALTEGDVGAKAGVASGATSVGLTGASFLTDDERARDQLRAAALVAGVGAGILPPTLRRWTRYEQPSAIGRAQEARMAQAGTRGTPEVRQLHQNFVQNLERRTGERLIDNLPPVDKVDEDFARRVAAWYENTPSAPNDPAVIRAWRAFADETRQQYEMLQQAGIKFDFSEADPYKNSAEMIRDVAENGRLRVFRTAPPGAPQVHPLLTNEENDMFRAVHDFFGHAGYGYQFGPKGEENAFRVHSAMYTPEARRAMATETRGQNSWVNFGPPADINRARPGSVYADNKVMLMPPELLGDYTGPVRLSTAEGPSPLQASATALRVAAPAIAGAASGDTTEERVQRGLAGAALGAIGPRLAGRGVGLSTVDVGLPAMQREALEATLLPMERRSVGRVGFVATPEMYDPGTVRNQKLERAHVAEVDQTLRATAPQLYRNVKVSRGRGLFDGGVSQNVIHRFLDTDDDQTVRLAAAVQGLVTGQDAQIFYRPVRPGDAPMAPDGMRGVTGAVLVSGPDGKRLPLRAAREVIDNARALGVGGATFDEDNGVLYFVNVKGYSDTPLDDATYQRAITQAAEQATSLPTLTLSPTSLFTEFLNGPRDYFDALAGDAAGLALADRSFLRVADAYRRYAKRIGANVADTEDRLAALGDELRARAAGLTETGAAAALEPPRFMETLYNRVDRAFEQMPLFQPKPGAVWLARFQKSGAPIKDEMEYMGLTRFLQDNATTPLSREQVADFLRQNRIAPTETRRVAPKVQRYRVEMPAALLPQAEQELGPARRLFKQMEQRYDEANQTPDMDGETFDAIQLDRQMAEEEYANAINRFIRTHLDAMVPAGIRAEDRTASALWSRARRSIEDSLELGRPAGYYATVSSRPAGTQDVLFGAFRAPEFASDDYFETSIDLPTRPGERKFRSPHFDDTKNPPMMHSRGSVERLPDGRIRMYGEETQDDWAQQGREFGFGALDQPAIDEATATRDRLIAERDRLERLASSEIYGTFTPRQDQASSMFADSLVLTRHVLSANAPGAWVYNFPGFSALRKQKFGDLRQQYQELERNIQAADDQLQKLRSVAPDRPYRQTSEWASLSLKRLLYEAAARGADELVLATGDQAARAVGGEAQALSPLYDQTNPNIIRRIGRELGLALNPEPLPPGSMPRSARQGSPSQRALNELQMDLDDLRQIQNPDRGVRDAMRELETVTIPELQARADKELAGMQDAPPNLRIPLTAADRQRLLRRGSVPMGRVDPEVLSAVGGAGAGAVAGAATAEPGDREGLLTGALTGAALGGAGAGALARRMARPAQGAMTPAQQAVLGTIRVGDRATVAPTRFLTAAERLYTKLVSETFPLEKAAGALGEALGRPAAREQMQNVIRKAQGSGQAALQFLEDKLRPVLTTVGAENLGAVRSLLKARRDLDIRQQGGAAKSTVDLPTLQQAVADGEANPRVAQAADAISDLYRELLDMRYDADLLSEEQYLAILASDQYYVPLIAELTQPAMAAGSRGTAWSVSTGGVARMNREAELLMDTADPIELLVSAAQRTFRDVGKAEVGNVLGALADLGPNPLIQPVNKANVRSGAMTFDQIRGGKRVTYEVADRELYHAIAGAPELTQDWFTRMARALKNLQTSGVTLVPAFAAANVIRDVPMSALQRLNTAQAAREVVGGAAAGAALGAATGEDESTFVNALRGAGLGMAGGALARPLGQTLLAMRDIAGNRAVYQQFLRDGGSTEGFFVRTPKDAAEILERLQRTRGFNPKDILNFRSYWDALRFIGSLGEQGPRLAAYKEALAEGKTPEQAVALAQDRTLRFANIGRSTKGIASVTPFWNAKVQGWDKLGRMLKNPKTYALGVTAITAPTLALWSTNKDNPEYWERPTWERNLFWLVPKGEGGGFWRIPKPFELGALFASTPERLLDYATQAGVELPGLGRIASAAPEMAEPGRQLGRAAREMAASTFEGTLPLPQFAALPAQLMFNRDLFRDRPIVSRPELLPEQQVQPQSSAIARQAARLGMSPEQVDFVLRDVAGTSGQELLNVTDVLARRAGLPAPEPLPNAPITGMFARRFQTQDVGQTESEAAARERLRALDRVTASQREAERRGGPAAAARFEQQYSRQLRSAERVKDLSRQLDSVSAERRKVQRNPNLSPEQRTEKLKQLRSRSTTISRQLLRIPD